MRADRLLSLLLCLQSRGRVTARQLAAELEVSVRTVYRDLDALSAAGVPVVATGGPGGGCELMEGWRSPLLGISAEETTALLAVESGGPLERIAPGAGGPGPRRPPSRGRGSGTGTRAARCGRGLCSRCPAAWTCPSTTAHGRRSPRILLGQWSWGAEHDGVAEETSPSPEGDVSSAASPGAGPWSVRPRAAVLMLLPAHHRGVPRPPRGVQAHTDEVAAALDEPDLECGVVRRSPVVLSGEEARFAVPPLEDHDDRVAVPEGADGVLARLRGSTVKSACSPGPRRSGASPGPNSGADCCAREQ